MQQSKNILVLGRTGSGKSTLCNALVAQNKFPVFNTSFSVTKDYDIEEFTYESENYRIIDTVGFCDTELEKEEVFARIMRVFGILKGSLDALLLVFSEPGTEETMKAMKEIVSVIFDTKVLKNTIIVKTNAEKIFQDHNKSVEEKKRFIQKAHQDYRFIFENCRDMIFIENADPDSAPDKETKESRLKMQQKSREIVMKTISKMVAECATYRIPNYDETVEKIKIYLEEDAEKYATHKKRIAALTKMLDSQNMDMNQFLLEYHKEESVRQKEDSEFRMNLMKSISESIMRNYSNVQVIKNQTSPFQFGFNLALPALGTINGSCSIQ